MHVSTDANGFRQQLKIVKIIENLQPLTRRLTLQLEVPVVNGLLSVDGVGRQCFDKLSLFLVLSQLLLEISLIFFSFGFFHIWGFIICTKKCLCLLSIFVFPLFKYFFEILVDACTLLSQKVLLNLDYREELDFGTIFFIHAAQYIVVFFYFPFLFV